MNASARALRFDEERLWVELADGRILGVPLAWFPRLLAAGPAERAAVAISGDGQRLHWEALDEDISVAGLLAGRADHRATITRLKGLRAGTRLDGLAWRKLRDEGRG